MRDITLGRSLVALILWAAIWSSAEAASKQPLTEGELDRVAAGGLDLTVQDGGDALTTLLRSALVVEQVVGNNQVTTEIHIVVGPEGIVSPQVVAISQDRDRSDGQGSGSSLVLSDVVPKDILQRNVMAAVVNNLMGMNQVASTVNVQILIGGALALPTTVGGAKAAGSDPLQTTTAASTPSILSPNTVWTPANVQSAVALFSTLIPANPDLAGDLTELRALAQPAVTTAPITPRRFAPTPSSTAAPAR